MFASSRSLTFVAACVLSIWGLHGCGGSERHTSTRIEFRHVPPSAVGGAGDTEILSGIVLNATADTRLVVYVHSRRTWYVQPLTTHPFTEVGRDGEWSTSTHLGDRYAALLVKSTYRPANTLRELPPATGAVEVVRASVGDPSSAKPEQSLVFSTYNWSVRQIGSDRNGTPHAYNASNVWVDGADRLHLQVAKNGSEWTCSEVALKSSLGYGLYTVVLEDTKELEPATVFSMFTWDTTGTDQERREMATELTRWGDPAGKNGEYTVQPFFRPMNTYRYSIDNGPLTLTMRWRNGTVNFTSVSNLRGERISAAAEHTFTSDIPAPKSESIHLNLCTFDYGKVKQSKASEVVVEIFRFLP